MTSNKALARTAGALYLLLAVLGGFSELYVRDGVDVPGNAAATAANIVQSETLFRVGALTDLVGITVFLVLGLILFSLLRPVSPLASTTMLVFVAVAVAVMTLNMANHLGALEAALDGSDAVAMRFLETHHNGYLVAGIFFGLWLIPLGYLLVRSGYAPRWLGILAMVGSLGYVADVVANVLFGTSREPTTELVFVPSVIAELALVVWLLVKGLDVPDERRAPLVPERAPVAA
jgi:Domain of unknown function (DUF4386)